MASGAKELGVPRQDEESARVVAAKSAAIWLLKNVSCNVSPKTTREIEISRGEIIKAGRDLKSCQLRLVDEYRKAASAAQVLERLPGEIPFCYKVSVRLSSNVASSSLTTAHATTALVSGDTDATNASREGTMDPKLVEILECSLCLELMEMPILLSCSHSFCRNCWLDWVERQEANLKQDSSNASAAAAAASRKRKRKSRTGDCPTCRKSVPVDAPVVLALQNLIEGVKDSGVDFGTNSSVFSSRSAASNQSTKAGGGDEDSNGMANEESSKASLQGFSQKIVLRRSRHEKFGVDIDTCQYRGHMALKVSACDKDSQGWRKGLRPNDLLCEVNDYLCFNLKESNRYEAVTKAFKEDSVVSIKILRGLIIEED
ncbi:Hypothetical Protein FCC1311_002982 [Hondaea fermentalgiana]|uniref:RING-type domain-containing protein n=1 Tax=Hondaea fermentalgiana TaxID=2315210 RepID=A0A2R5FZD0_9STRA|nr:Hypothetical Protein FCC1311_002982 [Hondaea fermentalgiana]|eukprot:GBG24080.1 Hypothetical Protein FCC1311_002982 [Hondaea fermentalgiana]